MATLTSLRSLGTNLTLTCPFPKSFVCDLPDSGRHVTCVYQDLCLSRSMGRVVENPGNEVGRAIQMKLAGDTKWSLGSCFKALPNRSYEVQVTGRSYRRNRHQLRTTTEAPPQTTLEDLLNNDADVTDVTSPVNSQDVTPKPVTQPRRSTHVRNLPSWHDDYLMNY